jgi:hypothetical protein
VCDVDSAYPRFIVFGQKIIRRGLVSKRMSHSKKLISGVIHKALMIPVNTSPRTIKKPQGSSLPRAID